MFTKKEGLKEAMTLVNQNLNACSKIIGDLGLKLCVDKKENGEGTLFVKTPSTKLSGYIRGLTYGGKVNDSYLFSLALNDRTLNLFVGNSFVKTVVSKKGNTDRKTLDSTLYIDAEGKIIDKNYVVYSCNGNSWRYENGNNHVSLGVNDHVSGSKSVYCSNSKNDTTLLSIITECGKGTAERMVIGRSINDDNYHALVNGKEVIKAHSFDEASVITRSLMISHEVQSVNDEVMGSFAEFIAHPELVLNSNALLSNESNDDSLAIECDIMAIELRVMFINMYENSNRMNLTNKSA